MKSKHILPLVILAVAVLFICTPSNKKRDENTENVEVPEKTIQSYTYTEQLSATFRKPQDRPKLMDVNIICETVYVMSYVPDVNGNILEILSYQEEAPPKGTMFRIFVDGQRKLFTYDEWVLKAKTPIVDSPEKAMPSFYDVMAVHDNIAELNITSGRIKGTITDWPDEIKDVGSILRDNEGMPILATNMSAMFTRMRDDVSIFHDDGDNIFANNETDFSERKVGDKVIQRCKIGECWVIIRGVKEPYKDEAKILEIKAKAYQFWLSVLLYANQKISDLPEDQKRFVESCSLSN